MVEFIQSPRARRHRQLVRFKFNHAEAGWHQLFLAVPCGITCTSTQWHDSGSATLYTSAFWWFHTHCIYPPWGVSGSILIMYIHSYHVPFWTIEIVASRPFWTLHCCTPDHSYLSCNPGRHSVRTSAKLVSPSFLAILTIPVTSAAYAFKYYSCSGATNKGSTNWEVKVRVPLDRVRFPNCELKLKWKMKWHESEPSCRLLLKGTKSYVVPCSRLSRRPCTCTDVRVVPLGLASVHWFNERK